MEMTENTVSWFSKEMTCWDNFSTILLNLFSPRRMKRRRVVKKVTKQQWWLQPGISGGKKRCVGDHALLDHAFFPCFKHFPPEETPLVSQEISFKCDDLDDVHTPPPTFSHQVCENLKDLLSEKVGRGTSPPYSFKTVAYASVIVISSFT